MLRRVQYTTGFSEAVIEVLQYPLSPKGRSRLTMWCTLHKSTGFQNPDAVMEETTCFISRTTLTETALILGRATGASTIPWGCRKSVVACLNFCREAILDKTVSIVGRMYVLPSLGIMWRIR